MTGSPSAEAQRTKLALLVYACADAGLDIDADSLRCVMETTGCDVLRRSLHGCILRYPDTSPLPSCSIVAHGQCLRPCLIYGLLLPSCICRQVFGIGLADATVWQGAFWLDDAARGEDAAEKLERACRTLPGSLAVLPLHTMCTGTHCQKSALLKNPECSPAPRHTVHSESMAARLEENRVCLVSQARQAWRGRNNVHAGVMTVTTHQMIVLNRSDVGLPPPAAIRPHQVRDAVCFQEAQRDRARRSGW